MTDPFVNINGTDRRALIQQRGDVVRALHAADQALAEATPNGRDYRDAAHHAAALAEHADWRTKVRAVRSDLETQIRTLQDGARPKAG